MSRSAAVLGTLLVYSALLLALGVWSARRTHSSDDFYLAGRRLGGVLAALSASASSSSAWTLLGVSGAAYAWGLKAVWLFPATVGGFIVNWLWVAPRLQRLARSGNALTLTEVLTAGHSRAWVRRIARSSAAIVLVSFMFYVAAQLQGAGLAFSASLDVPNALATVLGALIVLAYTLLGGFWAVSATDALQGLLMLITAVCLPLFGVYLAGGWGTLFANLATALPGGLSLTGEVSLAAGLLFVLGTLGIGLGYPGQPHVVNRFMALESAQALGRARVLAIVWGVLVYAGMLLLGWCARVLPLGAVTNAEQVLFEFVFASLPVVFSGVVVAAILSAVMSTADSQLLVAGSSVSHDWRLPEGGGASIGAPRLVVGVLTALALLLALLVPATIFSRVLFAWHAIGAAFAPPLLLRLCGREIGSAATFAAVNAGFLGTVVLHWLPDAPGDSAERLAPFLLSTLIVLAGARRGARV